MNLQKSIKRLTVAFVQYLDMSQDEKLARRQAKRMQRPVSPMLNRWFGVLPDMWTNLFKGKQ